MSEKMFHTFYKLFLLAAFVAVPNAVFAEDAAEDCQMSDVVKIYDTNNDCKLSYAEQDNIPVAEKSVILTYHMFDEDIAGVEAGPVRRQNQAIKNIRSQLTADEELEIGSFRANAGFSANNLGDGCSPDDIKNLIQAELNGIGNFDGKTMLKEFRTYAETALAKEALTMLFSSPAISAMMDGIKATANARMAMAKNSCNAREIMEAARNETDTMLKEEAIAYCEKHIDGTLAASKKPSSVQFGHYNTKGSGIDKTLVFPKDCKDPKIYSQYADNYYHKFNYATDLHTQLCFADNPQQVKCNNCEKNPSSCPYNGVTVPDCGPKDPIKECPWLKFVANVKANVSTEGGVSKHGRVFEPNVLRFGSMSGVAAYTADIMTLVNDEMNKYYNADEAALKSDVDKVIARQNITDMNGNSLGQVSDFCPRNVATPVEDMLEKLVPDPDATTSSNAGSVTNADFSNVTKQAAICMVYLNFNQKFWFELMDKLPMSQVLKVSRDISVVASSLVTESILSRLKLRLDAVIERSNASSEVSDDKVAPAVISNMREQKATYQAYVEDERRDRKNLTYAESFSDITEHVRKVIREYEEKELMREAAKARARALISGQ